MSVIDAETSEMGDGGVGGTGGSGDGGGEFEPPTGCGGCGEGGGLEETPAIPHVADEKAGGVEMLAAYLLNVV